MQDLASDHARLDVAIIPHMLLAEQTLVCCGLHLLQTHTQSVTRRKIPGKQQWVLFPNQTIRFLSLQALMLRLPYEKPHIQKACSSLSATQAANEAMGGSWVCGALHPGDAWGRVGENLFVPLCASFHGGGLLQVGQVTGLDPGQFVDAVQFRGGSYSAAV